MFTLNDCALGISPVASYSGVKRQTVQGYTASLRVPDESAADPQVTYPAGAPSILGMPYAAVSGPKSAVVGSTKAAVAGGAAALAHLSQTSDESAEAAAAEELKSKVEGVWEPFAAWSVGKVRPACLRD